MNSWKDVYEDILKEEKMVKLKETIKKERALRSILPKGSETLNAFKLCPFEKLKLIIVAQDPYPNKEHAHGLAFSSNSDKTPASLGNIFKEIQAELYPDDYDCFKTNNLTSWAEQGVLLINRVLTVEEGKSNSHKDMGWEYFTTKVIERLSESYPGRLIFVLWGRNAEELEASIDPHKHYTITGVHPSPLSANKGFFGNGHFLKIQHLLQQIYFEGMRDEVVEKYGWDEYSGYIQKWLDINNITIEKEKLTETIKFINGRIGEFIAMNNPEIKKRYEINFKT